MLDASGHWGGMAALGYALLGIEGERRDAERTGAAWAVYGKVRLPITVIALALGAAAK
jgi:hypothetical protein